MIEVSILAIVAWSLGMIGAGISIRSFAKSFADAQYIKRLSKEREFDRKVERIVHRVLLEEGNK